ncbi:MAG: pyridoxamine 5'-phosphate oxidase [Actinobacteria bacterium]|nr:pyridoxamine 5'-phosphate oxidase [Actinomycetota bacterium]
MDDWLESLDADPLVVLETWLREAREAGLREPEAAALATATADGVPSARMVLMRGLDENGLRFYTSYESRKAGELALNPVAALVFHWPAPLERQVRVEGAVERLDEGDSLDYFRSRPRGSQIGAWASPQSAPVSDRDELDRLYREAEERFAGIDDLPLPPGWGGYRLLPLAMELWQGRANRFHDRARYTRTDLVWSRLRLAP